MIDYLIFSISFVSNPTRLPNLLDIKVWVGLKSFKVLETLKDYLSFVWNVVDQQPPNFTTG
ncbi:hypothetical protein DHD32_13020 [Arenibacter sp. TNZ]|nr:hypothetical protein [Arenibacter sp. TNZ]